MDVSQKWIRLIGRLALGAIFFFSVAGKLTNWSGTVAFAASKGVPEILLVGATAIELVGAVLLLAGFKTRWGAAALVVFLIPVTLVFHGFWAVEGAQHQQHPSCVRHRRSCARPSPHHDFHRFRLSRPSLIRPRPRPARIR